MSHFVADDFRFMTHHFRSWTDSLDLWLVDRRSVALGKMAKDRSTSTNQSCSQLQEEHHQLLAGVLPKDVSGAVVYSPDWSTAVTTKSCMKNQFQPRATK